MEDQESSTEAQSGLKAGLGMLAALKEAIEETIAEARERGDLSTDRAREAVRGALSRAREAAGEAKERLDFATRQELEDLADRVQELKVRLENLERRASQDPFAGPARSEGEPAARGSSGSPGPPGPEQEGTAV